MTEAIATVNDFIFTKTEIEKFTVVNAKSNIASRRIKEKTGATLIRTDELLHHSGEKETEIWEVTKQSWIKTSREHQK